MKSPMEIARIVKSNELHEVEREIFDLVVKDKQWIADLIQLYVINIAPDVSGIRQLIDEYNNPTPENDGSVEPVPSDKEK